VKAVLAFDISNHDIINAASAGSMPVCLGYRRQAATLLAQYLHVAACFADTQVKPSLKQQQAAKMPCQFSG